RKTRTLASESAAQDELQRARGLVGAAARAVLYEEAAPLIERAQELQAELVPLVAQLAGLSLLARGRWYPFCGSSSLDLRQVLSELAVCAKCSDEELDEQSVPWVKFGLAVMKNPEEEF